MCLLKGKDGEINMQAKSIQNTVPSNENIPMKTIIQCDEDEQMKGAKSRRLRSNVQRESRKMREECIMKSKRGENFTKVREATDYL